MEGVERIIYTPSLNKIAIHHAKISTFYDNMHIDVVKKCLSVILEKIEAASDEELIIDSFLAHYSYLQIIDDSIQTHLGLLLYPKHGKVKHYFLNPKEDFFSNVHMQGDPLIVRDIQTGLHVHPRRTEDILEFRRFAVSNRIEGALLFKRNPFEDLDYYEGFREFWEETDVSRRY